MDLGFNELLSIALSLILCVVGLLIVLRPKPPPKTQRVQATAQASKETEYTAEEVAKHKTRDDLWVIIHGKVYDLTSYIDEHPGGDAIMNNAGADTTAGFEG